jgi:hypothetical protein
MRRKAAACNDVKKFENFIAGAKRMFEHKEGGPSSVVLFTEEAPQFCMHLVSIVHNVSFIFITNYMYINKVFHCVIQRDCDIPTHLQATSTDISRRQWYRLPRDLLSDNVSLWDASLIQKSVRSQSSPLGSVPLFSSPSTSTAVTTQKCSTSKQELLNAEINTVTTREVTSNIGPL